MMKKYNPKARYDHGGVPGQPGALPKGAHIRWPDGERGTVEQSYLGTRHLILRNAFGGGGQQQDSFDLAKFEGLQTDAKAIPRGRNGSRPQMADEPAKRRNISITDTDYAYAVSIGNGASDGIRVALEYHRKM